MNTKKMSKTMCVFLCLAAAVIWLCAQAYAVDFEQVSTNTFSTSSSEATYFKYRLYSTDGSKSKRFQVIITCTNAGGTPSLVQTDRNGNEIGNSKSMWGSHSEEFTLTRSGIYEGDYTEDEVTLYFKITGGKGSSFKIVDYPYWYNQDQSSAQEIYDNTDVIDYNHMRTVESKGSYGTLWYYIPATEKAWYNIRNASSDTLYVINGDQNTVYVEKTKSQNFLVNKGDKLYIRMHCTPGKEDEFIVNREEFNRITGMKFGKTSYSVVNGSSKTATLSYTLLNSEKSRESTYKVYGDSGIEVKKVDNTHYTITGKTAGRHTLTAKTSEGLTATTTVDVVPSKPIVNGAYSEGTYNKSTIKWGAQSGVKKYVVYLKNSKGNYVLKGTTTGTKFTIKELGANKTYYVKIASVVTGTANGKSYTLTSPKSDAIKVITAPKTAPTIKKVTALKTTYYKAKKVWHKGHFDTGGIWHPGYYTTTPAYSLATFKVSYTSVKGATGYQGNDGYPQMNKGVVGYTFSGKIKAGKKTSIRIRTIRKSGSSIAYGPWSAAKTGKAKAAK